MKRILAIVLTLAMVLSMAGVVATAADSAVAGTDGLVLQDISYDEILHRVSQGDSGFTLSSKYVYSGGRVEGENPMNDSGFQFYYIDLARWSSNSTDAETGKSLGYSDAEIDQWYLDWLDASLANLRANGGACMVRATYGIDGQQKCEPSDFSILLKHVEQLAGVFAEYPDIITTVECGMIGAFGEMWGGLYSNNADKAAVLGAWLTALPEEISVNVRTVNEYFYYVSNSDVFVNNYKNQTVNGVEYPSALTYNNYWMYTFPGEEFGRIGVYNDAMLQDGNDGGTFTWNDANMDIALGLRAGAFTFLANQSSVANYGGEFSGAKELYRYKLDYWMPLNAIPEFYTGHLSYYHGGNNAYKVTGEYYGEYNVSYYYTMETAQGRLDTLKAISEKSGSGMAYGVVTDENDAKVNYPTGATSDVMTYDEAVALAEEYNAALEEGATTAYVTIKTTITTGGWSSATVGDELLNEIAAENDVTADLSAYKGQSVAKFFEDHVGYRIVMRESYISDTVVPGGHIRIKGAVDNTGFANITKDKVTELVITNGTDTYVVETDLDANSWKSAQRSSYDVSAVLPDGIAAGEYDVYMRVANQDNEGNTVAASAIAFANTGDYSYTTPASFYNVGEETFDSCYSSEFNGNYIGSVTVDDTKREVAFADEDGTLLQTMIVEVGTLPEYTGETLVKDGGDACCYYAFAGWDSELTAVTANVIYTATYGDAVEHDNVWTEVTAPDIGVAGYETAVCNYCQETASREIPALDLAYGDANGDDVLNILDITVTAQYIAQKGVTGKFDLTACYPAAMDGNNDDKVDQRDINYIAAQIRAQ